MTTAPSGIVAVLQQGYLPIDERAALAALPQDLVGLPRDKVTFDLSSHVDRALAARDWHEARRAVTEHYRDKLKPVLEENADRWIAYYGTSPIPLALQLGYLVGTWRKTLPFQYHHERKDWFWEAKDTIDVVVEGMPPATVKAEGDVVVRVSTYSAIDPAFTQEIVSKPLAEVDVRTSEFGRDVLRSLADLERVADRFRAVLDELHSKCPNATTLHLFVACPAGLSFALGTRISPTIHPRVLTYEYHSASPQKYYPAFALQDDDVSRFVATDDEREAAAQERTRWARELARIRDFTSGHAADGRWLDDVVPESDRVAFCGAWETLPRACEQHELLYGEISAETSVTGGFAYVAASRKWILGDDFLIPLMRRISNEPMRMRAARLFLFHEAVHSKQGLTVATSASIGRFPRVLEEIDYQADVWAMLHEAALSANDGLDAPTFSRLLMRTTMETMLSFDDFASGTEMQVRRVNRYLIWAWQSLQTENLDPNETPWSQLSTKPTVELAGPEIRARDERVWYRLDARHTVAPELAVYASNRLHRAGVGPATPHFEILEALRARNTDRLLSALRGFANLAR